MRTVSIVIVAGALSVAALAAAPSGAVQDARALAPLPELKDAPAPAQVALGQAFFFDPRLSGDATISCAKCHQPDKAFGDGAPLSEGYTGARYFRNAPTLLNVAHLESYYWDGRVAGAATNDTPGGLEAVIRDHVTQAHFMQADEGLVWERLQEVTAYRIELQKIFGAEAGMPQVYQAVAAFVRTLRAPGAPFDRALAGEKEALSPEAQRGRAVFLGKGGCINCHHGPMLTDHQFHSTGRDPNPDVAADPERRITLARFLKVQRVPGYQAMTDDPGRFAVTTVPADAGRFRTPSLRNVGLTAPYMHDGSIGTLEEVVEYYSERMAPKRLTDAEKGDLIVFLRNLSGRVPQVTPVTPPPYDGAKSAKDATGGK